MDEADRRRSTVGLTSRGRAAAKVNETLLARVTPQDVERTRRTLAVLAAIGREREAQLEK